MVLIRKQTLVNSSKVPISVAQASFAVPIQSQTNSIIPVALMVLGKLEIKMDQLEQDSLSKTMMIRGILGGDNLPQNHLQDSKYNMLRIKAYVVDEINSYDSVSLRKRHIGSVDCRSYPQAFEGWVSIKKYGTVSPLGARSSKPANFYVNEYLTQKRSNILYKLRVTKKQNA